MEKKERIDLTLLLIFPVIASLVASFFHVNALLSILIFYGIPILYLSLRDRKLVGKVSLFSVIIGIPIIIIVDYLGELTQSWLIPHSAFPLRIFNVVTIEVIIWGVMLFYFTAMFYEHFLDKHLRVRLWNPKMKYLCILVLGLFSLFLMLLFKSPQILDVPYFYFWFGLIAMLIPTILYAYKFPVHMAKFFQAAAYFFYLNLLYEIVALKEGWWSFPGDEFVGWVSIAGVQFPFEEFFFWIMLWGFAALVYFDFFDET